LEILFITSTRIGDAVLSTGLLRHLIERHPGARVTVACGAPAAPLFEAMPGLRRVIVMRKNAASMHWLALWLACVGTRWDLVVDLRRSAIAWTLLARERRLLPRSREAIHRVQLIGRTLDLDPPPFPILWIDAKQEAAARNLLPGDQPTLAIAPTANWIGKICPSERFAELIGRLTAPAGPFAGGRVAVIGGKGEEALAGPVLEAVPASQMIDLFGLDLLTSYAVLSRCQLFIGNDSGLMHLAAAAGIPTLGLFGPTRDDFYAPWGPNGAVVRTPETIAELYPPDANGSVTSTLMGGLTVDAVLEATEALLRSTRAGAGSEAAAR
jgi:ADP-heptose:LPS heptosyltransferase